MKRAVDDAQPLAHNMRMKNHNAVALGRIGGSAKGPRKARTTDQARKAAKARWNKNNGNRSLCAQANTPCRHKEE